uniref:Uncharacterized protein n=1 Tax=Compsopogon caeruleus TaxID=31354 RepID=A0A7S1TDD6_9RHOD|mmetsp:Transcript_17640/g.36612  ORF Transcript_17640/g.36612 Transcript_17640/m.36612 type:complete len:474 (+) Transcript_17640:108-1529(+)
MMGEMGFVSWSGYVVEGMGRKEKFWMCTRKGRMEWVGKGWGLEQGRRGVWRGMGFEEISEGESDENMVEDFEDYSGFDEGEDEDEDSPMKKVPGVGMRLQGATPDDIRRLGAARNDRERMMVMNEIISRENRKRLTGIEREARVSTEGKSSADLYMESLVGRSVAANEPPRARDENRDDHSKGSSPTPPTSTTMKQDPESASQEAPRFLDPREENLSPRGRLFLTELRSNLDRAAAEPIRAMISRKIERLLRDEASVMDPVIGDDPTRVPQKPPAPEPPVHLEPLPFDPREANLSPKGQDYMRELRTAYERASAAPIRTMILKQVEKLLTNESHVMDSVPDHRMDEPIHETDGNQIGTWPDPSKQKTFKANVPQTTSQETPPSTPEVKTAHVAASPAMVPQSLASSSDVLNSPPRAIPSQQQQTTTSDADVNGIKAELIEELKRFRITQDALLSYHLDRMQHILSKLEGRSTS